MNIMAVYISIHLMYGTYPPKLHIEDALKVTMETASVYLAELE